MKNTKDLVSLHEDVFEKFEKFAISKEQSSKVQGGGSWLCHYQHVDGHMIYSSYGNVQIAIQNCSGDLNHYLYVCVGCEPQESNMNQQD